MAKAFFAAIYFLACFAMTAEPYSATTLAGKWSNASDEDLPVELNIQVDHEKVSGTIVFMMKRQGSEAVRDPHGLSQARFDGKVLRFAVQNETESYPVRFEFKLLGEESAELLEAGRENQSSIRMNRTKQELH